MPPRSKNRKPLPPAAEPAELIPLMDTQALRAAGLAWAATRQGWLGAHRRRRELGLQEAFIKVGTHHRSPVLVDVVRFKELLRERAARDAEAATERAS